MAAKRSHAADLLGVSRLAVEAVAGVTGLVEAVHMNVLNRAIGTPAVRPVAGITKLVYRGVRGVTRLVGGSIDAALARLVPVLGEQGDWQGRDALLAAVNGVLGDHLEQAGNPLAIRMSLRPAAPPSPRIAVLAHGLCMNDRQWLRDGVGHGALLHRERGYTPVYLHYNSGRHISLNGREFAHQLQQLADAWPVPVEELVIVGHSMGGLVARSAFAAAADAGHAWLARLTSVVFLGSPHHGAPLEKGGNWINLIADLNAYSAPFARLARIRSAGITDLRHGSVLDADWRGYDRFAHAAALPAMPALPAHVKCYAVAGTVAKEQGSLADRVAGDGLVPLASALGQHADPARSLAFTDSAVLTETSHIALLSSPAVRERLLAWL
jgi:pimeloyl-ACP methyl ester carboxylesterase